MVAADTYGATADLIVSMSQPSRGEFARGLANRSSLHMSGERRLAERVEFRPPSPRLRRGLILRRRHPAEARAEFRRERKEDGFPSASLSVSLRTCCVAIATVP